MKKITMLKIYTSKKTDGIMNLVNVSWSGLNIFKPYEGYENDAKLVKEGSIHAETLFRKYRDHMRLSYDNNNRLWNWFLNQNILIFGCDCNLGDLCHANFLAKRIFTKLGADYIGEFPNV